MSPELFAFDGSGSIRSKRPCHAVTEPSAVAPDATVKLERDGALWIIPGICKGGLHLEINKVDSRIRRYRARFCNHALSLIKLTHYPFDDHFRQFGVVSVVPNI